MYTLQYVQYNLFISYIKHMCIYIHIIGRIDRDMYVYIGKTPELEHLKHFLEKIVSWVGHLDLSLEQGEANKNSSGRPCPSPILTPQAYPTKKKKKTN